MNYKKMNLKYNNSLDIYGSWEELKNFFINNSSDDTILNVDKCEIIDWDKDLMLGEIGQTYYVFRSEEVPKDWLEGVARIYDKLEFNLIYQLDDSELVGELVYKNGELYHKYEIGEESYTNQFEIEVL